MDKRFVIITFQDPNDHEINEQYIAISNKSGDELQAKVDEIVKSFYNDDFGDWTYDDVYDELVKQKLIELPNFDTEWIQICA